MSIFCINIHRGTVSAFTFSSERREVKGLSELLLLLLCLLALFLLLGHFSDILIFRRFIFSWTAIYHNTMIDLEATSVRRAGGLQSLCSHIYIFLSKNKK